MESFPWFLHLNLNPDPNWQVQTFQETILNIMSNFVPNEMMNVIPRDPPWITKSLKTLLRKKTGCIRTIKDMGVRMMTKED